MVLTQARIRRACPPGISMLPERALTAAAVTPALIISPPDRINSVIIPIFLPDPPVAHLPAHLFIRLPVQDIPNPVQRPHTFPLPAIPQAPAQPVHTTRHRAPDIQHHAHGTHSARPLFLQLTLPLLMWPATATPAPGTEVPARGIRHRVRHPTHVQSPQTFTAPATAAVALST
jgi:hypothetical protein